MQLGEESVEANVLYGISPRKGSKSLEEPEWDASKDALFTSALEVVKETIEQNANFEWDLKPLFRLQMAYLLLWSAIERYVSLRYHLGNRVMEKVYRIAEEKAFVLGLKDVVKESRGVFRADRPNEKVTLDSSDPKKSIDYYYQIRSNITHRGKAVVKDFDVLKSSLTELNEIFGRVLAAAFSEMN